MDMQFLNAVVATSPYTQNVARKQAFSKFLTNGFVKNAKTILSHAITHLQGGKALKLIDTMMMTVMPLLKKYPKFSIIANHIALKN